MATVTIICPKCDWEPNPSDLWACTCGHSWHTFDTTGRCPACGKLWNDTSCHSPAVGGCAQWSPHLEWYRNLGKWVKEEVESVEVWVEEVLKR